MKHTLLIVAICLFIATSCKTISVSKDYDSSVDFTKFKTYSYPEIGFPQFKGNDLIKKRITNAIDQELTAKGFTKVANNPDLLVNIASYTEKDVRVDYDSFHRMYGYGYWRGFYAQPTRARVTTDYTGNLEIHFIDTRAKSLVWLGEGSSTITKNTSSEETLQKAVKKILNQFPPK